MFQVGNNNFDMCKFGFIDSRQKNPNELLGWWCARCLPLWVIVYCVCGWLKLCGCSWKMNCMLPSDWCHPLHMHLNEPHHLMWYAKCAYFCNDAQKVEANKWFLFASCGWFYGFEIGHTQSLINLLLLLGGIWCGIGSGECTRKFI